MQIKCKSLRKTSLISYQAGNQGKRSGINLDELTECPLAGDCLSLPCYPMNRECLSRKIQIEKEKKKKEKKYEKNTNQTDSFSRSI